MSGAVVITSPRAGEVYLVEPGYDARRQTLRLAAEAHPATEQLAWLVDGRPVAQVGWPYEAAWNLAPGKHFLQAVAGAVTSERVAFEVR